jgi:hypothetical protein
VVVNAYNSRSEPDSMMALERCWRKKVDVTGAGL